RQAYASCSARSSQEPQDISFLFSFYLQVLTKFFRISPYFGSWIVEYGSNQRSAILNPRSKVPSISPYLRWCASRRRDQWCSDRPFSFWRSLRSGPLLPNRPCPYSVCPNLLQCPKPFSKDRPRAVSLFQR